MPRKPPIWETHLDLPHADIKACERAVRHRHLQRAYYPAIIGSAIAFLALPLTAVYLNQSAHHSLMNIVYGRGMFREELLMGIPVAASIGLPLVAGVLTAGWLYRKWMHPILHDCFTRPRCVWCGYDLKGHGEMRGSYVRCPECGKASPRVRMPPDAPTAPPQTPAGIP
jgi:hypothetical protein